MPDASPVPAPPTIDSFIARWSGQEGGAERANYAMFLMELCLVLGVALPDPAGSSTEFNDYVFERAVRPRDSDTTTAPKRIDLYRKNAFILEAKQSRLPGKSKALPGQLTMLEEDASPRGRRGIARGWDVMMQNARRQAENYVFLLDADHPAPPFIIVCDVGRCLELYADFTGTGRAYGHFPDRTRFRVELDDLRKPEIRDLLRRIWTEPHALDPAKEAARVTREIAKRLAHVSKALEERGCHAEDVAHFLMRCLFTMFAEDVKLLPEDSFTSLLEKSVADPKHFPHRLKALWRDMERGEEFSHVIGARIRHFNGGLFNDTTVFELGREEIGELLAAARHHWTEVDPAIFGTLLEQALDRNERRKLGAHYTPRAYVQRLVEATVMEPLREDWQIALRKAEQATDDGDERKAVGAIRAFHRQLCATRVLDPACGTGNFLYVALELMKKLEGEVLEALVQLGEPESMGLDRETVDPHQFLGLELNPRAAAIAELVVWIGYLQQHYRTRTGHPSEPILRAFQNINFGKRQGYDAVLTWDGYPLPRVVEKDGRRVETYPNPRRPDWPEAEFIVGNPPFIGGKDVRARLGDAYAEALWAAHKHINASADFVMYWWDRAAEILAAKDSPTRRFGFVTTNSIRQFLQRRVVHAHLTAKRPVSLVFAIPDHPWTKSAPDSASVRIAMTVLQAGKLQGHICVPIQENNLDTDDPIVTFSTTSGLINSDLTCGVDVHATEDLLANKGVCTNGMNPLGAGFIVDHAHALALGLGTRPGLEKHIRPYRNGRDLTSRPRNVYAIDLWGLSADEVRLRFPEVYQHLLTTVKPEREKGAKRSQTRDAQEYAQRWWTFCKPRQEMREFLTGVERFIVSVQTARHRIFQFLGMELVPDQKVMVYGLDAAEHLGVLSSRIHEAWTLRTCSWLGVGNDSVYVKSSCFDPFPFPDPPDSLKAQIRAVAEDLDAFRKQRQAEHPKLTLTQMYNVLEKLRAMEAASGVIPGRSVAQGKGIQDVPRNPLGSLPSLRSPGMTPPPSRPRKGVDGRDQTGHDEAAVARLTADEERILDQGIVRTLKSYHDDLDRLVFQAYGWPETLSDDEILERLVALNAERAREEAAGHVRWLRPDYQIPRFTKGAAAKTGDLALESNVVAIDRAKPAFPKDRLEQPLAVEQMLLASGRAMDAAALARGFKGGGEKLETRIAQVLTTLVRFGRITALGDGRYAARRAA